MDKILHGEVQLHLHFSSVSTNLTHYLLYGSVFLKIQEFKQTW